MMEDSYMEARLSKLSIPPSLEEATWEQIKAISNLGLASSVFQGWGYETNCSKRNGWNG